ncbi:trypsin CFT-1-like [Leguminivora glycinivorella]|uniref:trypsin CFT-1-like n=1 Tax=Leguminivora glycinivorella TaxID=1035111 RepID=UPI00200F9D5E|nr:trypsin CFT-1-like [Leguminivora glycinivorella]
MRVVFVLMAFGLAMAAAVPENIQRIVGGEVTSIEKYPFMAAMMYSWNLLTYYQSCGGSVLNSRAILSAAHCFVGDTPSRWRVRVGSTMANSGGVVHHLRQIINHPDYIRATAGADIAILHTETTIVFNDRVQPMVVPGRSYDLPHNDMVVAIGWGTISPGGVQAGQLREVEVWHVSNAICRQRYATLGAYITNDMLCSGYLDVGGRDQCQGDSGGPLIHNGNVVVGVCSWGQSCALAFFPGVNAKVSAFTEWIRKTA